MENIIIFIGLFIIVYFAYLVFVILNKNALEKMKTGRELSFLKRNYNLNYNKLNMKKVVNAIAIANAFILSLTTTLVSFLNSWIDNFYIWLIVSLIMSILFLIPFILISYHLIGSHFRKIQKGVK